MGVAFCGQIGKPLPNRATHQTGRMRHQFGKLWGIARSRCVGTRKRREKIDKRLRIVPIDQPICGGIGRVGIERAGRNNRRAA